MPPPRRRPRMPHQTPPERERQILQRTAPFPTYRSVRIAGQLRLTGVGGSAAAVRAVWQRHGLPLRIQRLLGREQKTAAAGGVLTEALIRLLRKHRGRTVDPAPHVEAPYPGYRLCPDTSFVGTIQGVGKIYTPSVVAAHCSLGLARLYLSNASAPSRATAPRAVRLTRPSWME